MEVGEVVEVGEVEGEVAVEVEVVTLPVLCTHRCLV